MQKQSFLHGKLTCTTEIALNHNISHHHRGSPATLMSPSKDASSPIWLPACAVLIWLVLPSQQGKRNGFQPNFKRGTKTQRRNRQACAVLCCAVQQLYSPQPPPPPPSSLPTPSPPPAHGFLHLISPNSSSPPPPPPSPSHEFPSLQRSFT